MTTLYSQNPLHAQTTLTPEDTQTLRNQILIEELQDICATALIHAQQDDLRGALPILQESEPKVLQQSVDIQLTELTEALTQPHMGDCTGFPCRCTKCHAESLLGISTSTWPSTIIGYYLQQAFNPKVNSTHPPLDYLFHHWDASTPDTHDDYKAAFMFLKSYQLTHLANPSIISAT